MSISGDWWQLVGIPLLIFTARVCDVTISTLRIIFIARGKRKIAPLLAFFEIIIWLIAIGQIFQNLTNVVNYLAYAAGFATGNYLGLYIENKLALGLQVVRIITRRDATELVERLKKEGFGLTVVDAQGNTGPVKILFTLIKRKDLNYLLSLVQQYNPNAFYTVEDVRLAREQIYYNSAQESRNFFWNWFKFERKGK